MAKFYYQDEKKIRPGFYQRYENAATERTTKVDYGIAAITIQANWGPVGRVVTCNSTTELKDAFGTAKTVDAALALFEGGARRVHAYRLGTGGKAASVQLNDGTGSTPVVKISAKYPGTRSFTLTVRQKLGAELIKELLIIEGTEIKESIYFAAGKNEPDALVKAVADVNSEYITAEKLTEGDGTIKAVAQEAMSGGQDPTVSNTEYSAGFNALEAYDWRVICSDTTTIAVHYLLHEYIKRVYANGKMALGVVGEPTSENFATRKEHAASFDDEKMIYLGSGYKKGTTEVNGYKAVALLAGIVSNTEANQSIVHTEIPDATDLMEVLTNSQYEDAIRNGMILFSLSPEGKVWIDSGVNTLITPNKYQDEGWKKIKRVVTRFEMFQRVDKNVSPLIGKVNCDDDGIANVIQVGQGILNEMIAEKKLFDGASICEDPDRPYESDSAWFILAADDIDTLEKIYVNYHLRFSRNS